MVSLDTKLNIIINALGDIKGENIISIDTTKVSSLFNYIVVCSGNSTRQTNALANNLITELKEHQIDITGCEGWQNGEWVLVDCGEIIVHIMLPNVRAYYDLEGLWNE